MTKREDDDGDDDDGVEASLNFSRVSVLHSLEINPAAAVQNGDSADFAMSLLSCFCFNRRGRLKLAVPTGD